MPPSLPLAPILCVEGLQHSGSKLFCLEDCWVLGLLKIL